MRDTCYIFKPQLSHVEIIFHIPKLTDSSVPFPQLRMDLREKNMDPLKLDNQEIHLTWGVTAQVS